MKLYGLIGYPLSHSFSKQYFTEKFEKEGLADCFFEAFPITSIDAFPDVLNSHLELKGLSVTIPYKEQVLKFVDEFSPEVKFIGASNSLKITSGKIVAFNTDIIGFEASFIGPLKPHHSKALILGTGGASKAVQYVLHQLGIPFLIVSRKENEDKQFIPYNKINESTMSEYNIIINCSPVGMWPDEKNCPDIPYYLLTSDHYLFDLVYKPAETVFLQKGKEMGAVIKNGYDMLLIQAEASWEIWNGE